MPSAPTLARLLQAALHTAQRVRRAPARRRRGAGDQPALDRRRGAEPPRTAYPGDFTGVVHPVYAPDLNGDPDPGEVVWTWVPYEEDHTQGKDRPVLVVGRDGRWLLALMLTTRDHDVQPARHEETWVDVGTGSWDAQRRASEVRVDRVIRVDPGTVRREGAILDRARFDLVTGSLATARG